MGPPGGGTDSLGGALASGFPVEPLLIIIIIITVVVVKLWIKSFKTDNAGKVNVNEIRLNFLAPHKNCIRETHLIFRFLVRTSKASTNC